MPSSRITLKALKPKETDFEPKTLGQHLRKRRLQLGFTQTQAADQLGISPFTMLNLEKDRTKPSVAAMPSLIRWLGDDHFPVPKTLQERMRAVRRVNGWTIREAAIRLGVYPGTWAEWERSGRVPWERLRERLEKLLAGTVIAPGRDTSR